MYHRDEGAPIGQRGMMEGKVGVIGQVCGRGSREGFGFHRSR